MRIVLIAGFLVATAFGGEESARPAVVTTARGPAVFLLDAPDAAVSTARLDALERVGKDGMPASPLAGYVVTNRVVVRLAADRPSMPGLVRSASLPNLTPIEGAPGYYTVTADTVAEAIELADALSGDDAYAEAYLDISAPKVLRLPSDPGFAQQWHLVNTDLPVADIAAQPAWDAGYTGAGTVVGILEGGWQYAHPDLAANYYAAATQSGGYASSHGTSCAGVVAAVPDNGQGGVGLAYDAQISGQIYGSDSQTAAAFGYRNDLNDIKSNSWGPADDGTVTYLSSVERTAIETGVASGRGGLGEIFVWAAGNGGTGDRVDYDPYASSRYTIAIGAIGDGDYRAYYNETGSSMFAVAHSSGNSRGIYTTTSGSSYTSSFGGTSSASPLAAAAVALMLDANPALTWRDVQHVIANSARINDAADSGWTTNAAGHDISYDYGFGAIDAYAAATTAANWTNVEPEVVADTGVIAVNQSIPDNNATGLTKTVEITDDVNVESVELILNVDTTYVGDLRITLTSPSGTESLLAAERADPRDNYVDYIFTTVRNWDELSTGMWTVKVADQGPDDFATWIDYRVKVYGTAAAAPTAGDVNCDGAINYGDIDPFVMALTDPGHYAEMYPECDRMRADVNGDGLVNNADIDPFVALLTGL